MDSVRLVESVVLLRQQVAELSCQLNELKQSWSENNTQQLSSLLQEVAVLKSSVVSSLTASDHSSVIAGRVTQPADAGEEVVLNHDEDTATTPSIFTSLF